MKTCLPLRMSSFDMVSVVIYGQTGLSGLLSTKGKLLFPERKSP